LPPKLIRTYDRNTYGAEKKDARLRAAHLQVAVVQASGVNALSGRRNQWKSGLHWPVTL